MTIAAASIAASTSPRKPTGKKWEFKTTGRTPSASSRVRTGAFAPRKVALCARSGSARHPNARHHQDDQVRGNDRQVQSMHPPDRNTGVNPLRGPGLPARAAPRWARARPPRGRRLYRAAMSLKFTASFNASHEASMTLSLTPTVPQIPCASPDSIKTRVRLFAP